MENKKIDTTTLISYVAIIAIVVSLAFIGFRITGFALSDTATINVTITDFTAINFTVDFINFGSGSVDAGTSGATISTDADVVNGTGWSRPAPLVLENIGNTNATINLSSSKTPANFIGGANPAFRIRVYDRTGNTGACVSPNPSTFGNIGTTNLTICNPLRFPSDMDEVNISVQLFIPSDASGSKTTTLTAYATAAA